MKMAGLVKRVVQAKNSVNMINANDPCECNCDCTIEVEYHKEAGFQFRGVDTQFTIEFYSSKSEMDIANEEFTINETP